MMKETEENTNNILFIYAYFPKQFTDSMQLISKFTFFHWNEKDLHSYGTTKEPE
jgi:hypothetical protein